ncbi:hypothetical protein D7X33_22350 [Butyricicoccus sp. 1XD8-22]|nr:hypothetical protein D7X33_22350 [Butyricicoccus sp. 1XD8-22]
MKIIKKDGNYVLFINQSTSVELERKTEFRLRDIVQIGTVYYQVVNVFDSHNSVLPNGEAKYVLDQMSAENLIEMAYSVIKI